MRTATRIPCAALAALALAGCFAEVEGESITYKQSLPVCAGGGTSCTFQGAGPLADLLPFNVGASTEFTADLGDQEFLKPKKDLGPATLENKLTLNRTTLQMTTGASFSGIVQLKLLQLTSGRPCTAACAAPGCQELATYDQARDGPATDTVVLKGSSVNMLDLMSGGQLTLCVVGRGTPPSQDWRADATLDLKLVAHASLP